MLSYPINFFKRKSNDVVLWTPAEIDTHGWYDGSDAATITTVPTGVSQWNDKSGNNRHLNQSNTSRQGSYPGFVQNSLNTVTFNPSFASSGSLFTDNFSLPLNTATEPFTVCYASRLGNAWADFARFFTLFWVGTNNDVNNNAFMLPFRRNTTGRLITVVNGTEHDTTIPLDATPGSFNIYLFSIHNSNAVVRFNGTQVLSVTGSTTQTIQNFAIGLFSSTSVQSCRADHGEIIVTPGNDLTRYEGYLAHRWGLTGSLPVDHPYKNSPPVI